MAAIGEDGVLTVADESPRDLLITLGDWYESYHVVPVDGWSPGEVCEVRLGPVRDVEFVVGGIEPEHELANARLYSARARYAELRRATRGR